MEELLNLLNSNQGKQIIQGISGETGAPTSSTANVLSMALPLLMGSMKRNASSPQGAASLLGALSGSQHDGSLLDNLGGLFSGGVDQSVKQDGAGILNHVLGSKQTQVNSALSQKSGLSADTVGQILKVAAPLVLAYLGKQTRQQNVNSPQGMEGLLGSIMGGGGNSNAQSLVESFLDSDGDGSVLDDVAGLLGGSQSQGGGLGSLLGGFLK